jgi:hypothetical protein
MKKLYSILIAGCLTAIIAPIAHCEDTSVGSVKEFKGQVLINDKEGEPFVPAKTGLSLFQGGAVIVMDDASVLLEIKGRGNMHLTDNAAIQLKDVAATGEFTRVTAVRAPVLFLYPTGLSASKAPGITKLVFGINHNLDKLKGAIDFKVYALHEDSEDELDEDASLSEFIKSSLLLASFKRKEVYSENGYTWYNLQSDSQLTDTGEYTVYLTAQRDKEETKLGQSTLLIIEESD